jgi:hypothetical protein
MLVALSPVACGSDDKGDEAKQPAPGAETPPPRLPARDSRGYAQLQAAAGALRAAATPVAYGVAPTIVATGSLRAAARRLRRVSPTHPQLRRLRRATLEALDTAAAEGGQEASAKQAAKSAIAEADRIDAGLRSYSASHPAANEIAPG